MLVRVSTYYILKILLCLSKVLFVESSVAQSSEQGPFTSEFVGWILATDSCEESVNALSKVLDLLRLLRFVPTGKVNMAGVRKNTVKKTISQLL